MSVQYNITLTLFTYTMHTYTSQILCLKDGNWQRIGTFFGAADVPGDDDHLRSDDSPARSPHTLQKKNKIP